MSFFGFDARLPEQRDGGTAGSGEYSDIDAKLEAMRLASGEDIEVYTWGEDAYDRLADGLEESLDDYNDDTFGVSTVDKDFDYSGSTAKLGSNNVTQRSSASYHKLPPPGRPVQNAWSAFNADPLLGPSAALSNRAKSSGPSTPIPSAPAPAPVSAPAAPAFRTLEEIEAEMLARQRSAVPAPAPAPVPVKQPLTLAEIEAQMMANARPSTQEPLAQQAALQQPPPPTIQILARPQPPQQSPVPLPARTPIAPDALPMLLDAQQRQHEQFNPPLPAGPPVPNLAQQRQQELRRLQDAALQLRRNGGTGPGEPNEAHFADLVTRIEMLTKAEAKHHRIMQRIDLMSRENGIMSKGDKDFITRIQVSQLLNSNGPGGTHDPYTEDFYYHVLTALRGPKAPSQVANVSLVAQAATVVGRGAGSQAASTREQKAKNNKRESAMLKMAQQVQRIVDQSKKKPRLTQISLDGALGKIAIRGKSAPKQMLQVSGAKASSDSTPTLSTANGVTGRKPNLTRHEALLALEKIYDSVLELEQLRRVQPRPLQQEGPDENMTRWETDYSASVARMWKLLRVNDPLGASAQHPFVTLLGPTKGKRVLPRILRHLDAQQGLTLVTLLIATFETLDVVRDAALVDSSGPGREEAEAQTELFLGAVLPFVMTVIAKAPLRVVTGMTGLLLDRNDLLRLARTKPGIAFLTLFLSRAETLKQSVGSEEGAPGEDEISRWQGLYDTLFGRLHGNLVSLFPSTRAQPFGKPLAPPQMLQLRPEIDRDDEPVWSFLAALAVSASAEQQQLLISEVRDKILENVVSAKKQWVPDPIGELRIRNVNVLLGALGLDASQISID
ncbi:uncharacterized protein L969DRAFT_92717 [Mixia osmundae IAM 14324]|uniref:mRNA decay factor PAT1 domain-containing protein n=1 Tax=Mixia osmundae (strain CBS 9802 / IAM 14324 / JCM 22182 / KY 12970) TaxID=764103 RepID=G7DYC5_MIXOS|nr:uncharacterized protein L969DRAFT_92717 [Mixia osmundae IAM 14324]KEI41488.1 hypothetical protein L969DRAFT_92717 [Mixia osmundae IAM 14324]GAA95585.1 hypothetical protein E5Q_02241 [Mixia osmundae IAM 14324]